MTDASGFHESCKNAIRCLKERGWRFYLPVSLVMDARLFWDDMLEKKLKNPEKEYDDSLRQFIAEHGIIRAWDCVDEDGNPLDPRKFEDYAKQDFDDWHLLFHAFFAKITRLDAPN